MCPIVKSYGRPRLGIIEYGADVADSQWVMATAINGVAFQFANTIDEDPMFPMSVDNEQPLDICLGHNQLNADSGMYHYHGISPCINQQFLRRKEMDACNGNRECSNDLVEWMLSGFRDTVFYSNKTVIGLSKFGHVLYGPYNDYGELWDVEVWCAFLEDVRLIMFSKCEFPNVFRTWTLAMAYGLVIEVNISMSAHDGIRMLSVVKDRQTLPTIYDATRFILTVRSTASINMPTNSLQIQLIGLLMIGSRS